MNNKSIFFWPKEVAVRCSNILPDSINVQVDVNNMSNNTVYGIDSGDDVNAVRVEFDQLTDGSNYVLIDTKGRIYLNRISDINKEKRSVTLTSLNPSYPSFKMFFKNIDSCYRVYSVSKPG